jgi:hypothetical protein
MFEPFDFIGNKPNINTMKTLLAVIIAASCISCAYAQSYGGTSAAALDPRYGYPYYSPPDSPFRKWTTKHLQERRLDLYRQTPQRQTSNLPGRNGVPVFIHHEGEGVSDQNKEIFAIEAELNRRYQAGDKHAELKRAMPGQQHP